jgi:hypothetical protein
LDSTAEYFEETCFTGAVGADDTEYFTGFDGE